MSSISNNLLTYINEQGYIEVDYSKIANDLGVLERSIRSTMAQLSKDGLIDRKNIASSKSFNINDCLNTFKSFNQEDLANILKNYKNIISFTNLLLDLLGTDDIQYSGQTVSIKDLKDFWNKIH
jgi:CTP-dependent riboflavin kinase